MIPDVPIQHVRATTFRYKGHSRRGNVPREFITLGDTITFQILKLDATPLLVKTSPASGVTVDDDGGYEVVCSASEMALAITLDYRYLVLIHEGDTGETYPLRRGPLQITI